jgi:hypothetical protein
MNALREWVVVHVDALDNEWLAIARTMDCHHRAHFHHEDAHKARRLDAVQRQLPCIPRRRERARLQLMPHANALLARRGLQFSSGQWKALLARGRAQTE